MCVTFSRALGTAGPVHTQFIASGDEVECAGRRLQALGLTVGSEGKVEPFIAVFVGGHAGKVCPLQFWIALMQGLDNRGKRFVTFVGPEEKASIPALTKAMETMKHGVLCPHQPVRLFAAMLAQSEYLITPDSGPMHIAAALRIPIVMMVRTKKSLEFLPPGPRNYAVWDLDVGQVVSIVSQTGDDPFRSPAPVARQQACHATDHAAQPNPQA